MWEVLFQVLALVLLLACKNEDSGINTGSFIDFCDNRVCKLVIKFWWLRICSTCYTFVHPMPNAAFIYMIISKLVFDLVGFPNKSIDRISWKMYYKLKTVNTTYSMISTNNYWATLTHINRLWSRINSLPSASAIGAQFWVAPPTFMAISSQNSHL